MDNYMENKDFPRNIFYPMQYSYMVSVIQENFRVTAARCPITGVTCREEWYDNNWVRHRWDEPAIIERDRDSGIVTELAWCQHGQYHRENGEPALLQYARESGKLIRRFWYSHGEYHRPDDLPHAEFLDEETGIVVRAEYRVTTDTLKGSQPHRIAGPAVLLFDRTTGEQVETSFYRFGRKLPAPSGPTVQI